MSIIQRFLQDLEERIAEIKGQITLLEPKSDSNGMQISKGPSGAATDVTKEQAKSLKENIQSIEAVLNQYRDKA